MITDFMADYHRLTGRTQGPDQFNVSTDAIVNGFLEEAEIVAKWQWLLDYIIQLSTDENHPETDNLIAKTGNIWRWTIHAFLNKDGGLTISTVDFRIEEHANGFWSDMPTVDPTQTYTEGQELVLEVPVKEGFTFKGWYDNLEFIGTPITKITTIDTGNLTLYARWEKIIVPEDITKAVADDIDEVEFDLATINLDLEVVQDPVDKTKAKISGNLVVEVFAEDTVKGFGKVSDLIPVGATSDRYALVAWNIGLETHIWIIGNTTESFVVVRNEIEYTFDVSDLVWPVEEVKNALETDIDEVEFDLATINLDLTVVQDPADKTKVKISGNLVVEVFAEDTVKGFGKVSDLIPVGATSDRYALVAWNIGLETHIWIIGNTTESFVVVRNEIEYTFDVSDLVWPVEEVVLPSIDEVRNLDVDTDVEFVGVVTGFTDYSTEYSNYDKVFVEDSTGAIVVYRAAFPADLKIGDKFLIVGKLGQYNGLIQIAQGATVTLIDSDNDLILPVEVTNVAEINEDFQAKRIDLEGTVVSVTSNGQTMVVKVGENEITVRSNSDSNAHIVNAHLLTAVIGQEVNLNGIHVDWFNGAQLLPTTVEQIVFVELSDEMKVADAKANLIVPSIVATEEISLPTEGLHGTVITWASSNETIIATDGTVVLPTEETEVTLTATITLGEVTDTKEFLVTVFPLGSEPQILNQSDFGETDGWGNYGERTDQAIEHGEEDPNPSGNSSWDLNGGNVNNTGWDYIRMGGKAASTKEGLQVYLKTNFTFEVEIKEIIIDIVGLDSASGNETIWLQTSTDGESWTDVTSKEITAVGDLVFDNLTIASGNYFRFVIVRGSTSSNKGTDIKTITFKG